MQKVDVCNSIEDVKSFITNNKEAKFCLYLAYKDDEAWEKSTSRVYMNKIDKKLIYLPVNILKDDFPSLKAIYELSENSDQIIGINQTQPHKSNVVLKERFRNQKIPSNVDCLIKSKSNKLECYNLNGFSFVDWFINEVSSFKDKTVILLGVGGVGEPIARSIAKEKLRLLYLVDINSKEYLVKELSSDVNVRYFKTLNQISQKGENLIFINCAGKEGIDDKSAIEFLKRFKNMKNIFVDLRPQLNIDIVNIAKELGWEGYTGFGMNSRNDYMLLKKLSDIVDIDIPNFEEFKKMVADAS